MRLFSTDIDGTIYDGPETARRFGRFWEDLRERDLAPLLSYNTGRLLDDAKQLVTASSLPEPEFLICGVGTQIYDYRAGRTIPGWTEELGHEWDFGQVEQLVRSRFPDAEMQPAKCQNPFKCSWYWNDRTAAEIDGMTRFLHDHDLEAQIVYSSQRDLDILPRRANKGNAVRWLADYLGIPGSHIVVAGDSGNDASMFGVRDAHGIIVSNAESALPSSAAGGSVFQATLPCADGVIEGLSHHLELDSSSRPLNPSSG